MNKRKDGAKGVASKSAGLAGKAPARASATADSPTLALVRELALIATEFDLSEIEVVPSGGVRVARRAAGSAPAAASPAIHAHAAAPTLAPSAPAASDDNSVFVTSPFVGTFYSAPSPEAGPYTTVGQAVRKGQVVCIIEAMKLMNEIESEADGKVADVLVKNGEHVEYGQKLFRLLKA
jgi:acetyl-CoA carboxylase biotin carboxyl carrier protein